MKEATLAFVALFALTIQSFELNLYYRNKGRFREKRDIVHADLSMIERGGLIAHISLGTPAQNFCVIVDTTLDVTLVLSSHAYHVDWTTKRRFNRRLSTTDETILRSFSVKNMGTTGVKDHLQIDGYPVGRLTFSLLGVYSPRTRLPTLGDGHLGLGYPDVERRITDFSVLDVMSTNQMIDYKRFTLFCVCAAHRNEMEPDARIVFGSHGTINPDEFQMVPLEAGRGYWRLRINTFGTVIRQIFGRSFVATLDSTSWLNKLSDQRAERVNTALGATKSGNVYVVDCNQVERLPTLRFGFEGVQFDVPPQIHIQKEELQGQTRCFSSIVPDPEITTERMVIGMAFLEHFTTIFDQQQQKVGFKPRVC